LNVPENEMSFKEFIRSKYKTVDANVSYACNHTNYKIYFTNNVGKPIGGKQGKKSLIYDFVKNKYTYSIDDSILCWFGGISFLIDPPKLKESVHARIAKAR
jgi:hypothetical protein